MRIAGRDLELELTGLSLALSLDLQVDLNANDPEKSKDVSRLRQMLIQLKNDPLTKE
jgi:hypothetical protein